MTEDENEQVLASPAELERVALIYDREVMRGLSEEEIYFLRTQRSSITRRKIEPPK